MAQIDSQLAQFTAATAAATLSTGRKLIRNFRYYRSAQSDLTTITSGELLLICHTIRMDMFGMHNLLNDEQMQQSPFLVSLAARINDSFENLHRKVLFFDADLIEMIIPEIDSQRDFWAGCTEPSFYNFELTRYLEHTLPVSIKFIENQINQFPDQIEI
ncbi:MAG: hypothetical protein JJU37_07405 [Balneolaceae bacterium]|nr:hypothetical protein [Balneolaceae bacterium]